MLATDSLVTYQEVVLARWAVAVADLEHRVR